MEKYIYTKDRRSIKGILAEIIGLIERMLVRKALERCVSAFGVTTYRMHACMAHIYTEGMCEMEK